MLVLASMVKNGHRNILKRQKKIKGATNWLQQVFLPSSDAQKKTIFEIGFQTGNINLPKKRLQVAPLIITNQIYFFM